MNVLYTCIYSELSQEETDLCMTCTLHNRSLDSICITYVKVVQCLKQVTPEVNALAMLLSLAPPQSGRLSSGQQVWKYLARALCSHNNCHNNCLTCVGLLHLCLMLPHLCIRVSGCVCVGGRGGGILSFWYPYANCDYDNCGYEGTTPE